ncbi:hypothetical protein ACHAXN_010308 [Cyclotella atomus]
MKLALAFYILPFSAAFIPTATRVAMTELSALSRREALLTIGTSAALLGAPTASKAGTANPFLEEEVNYEPSQMPQGDKIDINGAFHINNTLNYSGLQIDYKQLPGFYPHAAGKIASSGPYSSVKDIYNIPGITDNDKKMFKKYESQLTVLPPGRMFKERINQRQST